MMKKWRYIDESEVSASTGLATDEYLTDMYNIGSEYHAALKLYNYKDYAALAGRFQNISAEIDLDKCETLGFGYGRRLTGGGAIIMGSDQLGICMTTSSQNMQWEHISELYTEYSKPIIQALKELGITASFRSKNDIEVGGKKIAGLGVYVSPSGNIQFHTSLLLDLDIGVMLDILNIPIQKFSDKRKTDSIERRITTIRREAFTNMDMKTLKALIAQKYSEHFRISLEEKAIGVEERISVEKLVEERYNNQEWIFQNSPQADMTGISLKKTKAGLLRTYIGLKGENIKSVLITGDFMDGKELLADIESRLKWSALDRDQIHRVVERAIEKESMIEKDLIQGLSVADIVDAIWALAGKRYTYNGTCYYPES